MMVWIGETFSNVVHKAETIALFRNLKKGTVIKQRVRNGHLNDVAFSSLLFVVVLALYPPVVEEWRRKP